MNFEQTINHVIANGARIAESGLGTILPTAKSERLMEEHYQTNETACRKEERKLAAQYPSRTINGEVRFYASETRYAIISRRDRRPRWFESRADGHTYAA